MNFYILVFAVACAIGGASSGSIRNRKQAWAQSFPDHFHFPGDSIQMDEDDFNKVIDFPNNFNEPNNFQPNGFRPPQTDKRPPANNRPQPTTPATTVAWSSTPRTYHLAPEGCNCPFTPQFNPVCGSDGNTYKNAGLLKCFRRCGIDVAQRRMGAC